MTVCGLVIASFWFVENYLGKNAYHFYFVFVFVLLFSITILLWWKNKKNKFG